MARLAVIPKYRFQKRIKTPDTEHVWNAFLNENNLEQWMHADSRKGMRASEHFQFEWRANGREITGYIEQLDPYDKIVLKWRIADAELHERWPEGQYVRTTLHFSDIGDEVYIDVQIEDIPFGEQNTVRELWENVMMHRLEEYLEDDPELEEAFS